MSKPKIVIACGDPNGIGPEIAIKILNDKTLISLFDIKVVIPASVVEYYCSSLDLNKPDSKRIIDIPDLKFKVKVGRIDKKAGHVAADSIRIGVELCLRKQFDALVTLPISKKAFNLAGFDFPGHTEYLRALTGCERTIMIMYSKNLTITPVTIHVPLRKVTSELEKSVLKSNLILLHNTLIKNFKVKSPKIAVLAINPHGGEGGLHGFEEKTKLEPVIKELNSIGMNVQGPFPADGFFGNHTYEHFDAVAGAYHDQALIPFKILSEGHGVNYTAGLPIIRTSPTHGTAFDIAGKNKAGLGSTIEAIKLAAKLINTDDNF